MLRVVLEAFKLFWEFLGEANAWVPVFGFTHIYWDVFAPTGWGNGQSLVSALSLVYLFPALRFFLSHPRLLSTDS